MSELRKASRKAVRVAFRCGGDSGAGELVFDSADLSVGGAFLVSDVLLEPGETVAFEFSLDGGAPLRCEARVAWVRRFPARGQEAGMGVQFLDLQGPEKGALERFVAG